jgi:hypothetical protein
MLELKLPLDPYHYRQAVITDGKHIQQSIQWYWYDIN